MVDWGAEPEPAKYKPSRYEKERLSKFEIVGTDDTGIDVVDHELAKWEPSEEQESFLEHLLEGDKEHQFKLYKSITAAGCNMKDLHRWCRQQPHFLALFKNRIQERFTLSEAAADMVVMGAAEGELAPTKDEKWGVDALLKLRDFIHKKELRFIQINQQFNMGPTADQDDEALMRVIDDAGDVAAKTIATAIEGGTS